tara:strand:- start:40 stop:426 length:387 start_codon:yes stop_codon:yes gene_type:complete
LTKSRKIPLGSPVIIDTTTSKYNFNNKSNREIALMPEGVLTGYIYEFSEELLVVKLRSNLEIRVSEYELSDCTRKFYSQEKTFISKLKSNIKDFFKIKFILISNRDSKYLLNPINFVKWIKYTLKDVI